MGRHGNICTVYECFLDDSKDERQRFSYVCAGFYGSRAYWKRFRLAWDDVLKGAGLNYYKTSEFKGLTGQFQEFRRLASPKGREAANLVKQQLMDVAHGIPQIKGIGVAVPVKGYQDVMAHPLAHLVFGKDPYDQAFMEVLYKTALAIPRGYVAFSHDDGPDFDHLRLLYNVFADLNPATAKKMGGFLPLDDKLHGPLQAADMFANSIMGGHTDLEQGLSVEPAMIDFLPKADVYKWTKSHAYATMRHELKRKGHIVPEDLYDDAA